MYDYNELRLGDIVEVARVVDPRGRKPKSRPVVIVDDPGEGFVAIAAVAVSSTLPPTPLPDTHVPLSWNAQGSTSTRLRRRSAALCDWKAIVTPSNYVDWRGEVSDAELEAILNCLDRLRTGGR